jgi:SIR2-like domain
MLLGGVQIPAEVVTAWEERNLVIFTGAGISIDPPSDLPSFPGLAAQVARTVQSPLDPAAEEWKTQLDTFMDVLNEGEGVDVHRLVQGIVTKPGSQPNANHNALARIAAKYSTRVVTTNYDLHLETALRAHHEGPLDVFRAPAMPLGGDFDGLVYLHGSAEDDPRRLVVTDRDFSSAYFHSAWAARFLERMFRKYVVLFVGYSHSDVVMKYLGLGLGPESKRYVLTDDPGNAIWRRLQVTALEYPAGRHDLLTGCLVEWSKLGGMGLLDHRQRLRELISTASEPAPDEESYLEDCSGVTTESGSSASSRPTNTGSSGRRNGSHSRSCSTDRLAQTR